MGHSYILVQPNLLEGLVEGGFITHAIFAILTKNSGYEPGPARRLYRTVPHSFLVKLRTLVFGHALLVRCTARRVGSARLRAQLALDRPTPDVTGRGP